MRTGSSGSGKAYSPKCLEAPLIALCPGPIEEDRWGASTHRGVLSGDDGLAYQPRWGYAVRDERRELEEAGETPRARYLVRLARHGKSGKLHEQIYDRAELVSRQAENEAMRSGRDGSPRSDERGQEEASGSDVDNGTGDSEAIEEVLAFYREAQEALKDLPVKKVAEKEGEIRQQHRGALATLKDLGGRDPREAQELHPRGEGLRAPGRLPRPAQAHTERPQGGCKDDRGLPGSRSEQPG
jgi:hypothetical protein